MAAAGVRAADEEEEEEMVVRTAGAGHRLTHIINNLTKNRHHNRSDCNVVSEASPFYISDTGTTNGDDTPSLKPRKRRLPAMNGSRGDLTLTSEYNNNNPINHNHNTQRQGSPGAVKNERLSPGTPDTLSRSRSVTPSSASYPGTPPAADVTHPANLPLGRNYSDFMRSLAAKYNNTNPNDYFGGAIRNGYPLLKPPLDLHPGSLSPSNKPKPPPPGDMTLAAAAALLNPFNSPAGLHTPFPPLIDMSSTHALLAMVRSAKEAEVQGLLKSSTSSPAKRQHQVDQPLPGGATVPLDLSAATATVPSKRARTTPPVGKEEREKRMVDGQHHQHHLEGSDIAAWTVDDVCSFVGSIDICAEYVQKFREQRIDGSGLPLLTEDHLTSTMGLKLGPALKLRSLLARKTGSCSVCLHCVHCHSASGSTTSSPGVQDHVGDGSTPGAPT